MLSDGKHKTIKNGFSLLYANTEAWFDIYEDKNDGEKALEQFEKLEKMNDEFKLHRKPQLDLMKPALMEKFKE